MNEDMRSLLYALFDGNVTDDERRLVEEWLADAQDNRAEYDSLLEEYMHVRWAMQEVAIDERAGRSAIAAGIRRRRARRRGMRYAAAACVALLITGATWFTLSDAGQMESQEKRFAGSTIQSIQSQAVLVLSDGSEVRLADADGEIIEKDGSMVRINGGELEYGNPAGDAQDEPIYNTVRVPRGSEFHLRLSDGTEVWLNSDSEFQYPVRFSGDRRETRLPGEGYFSVQTDPQRPFTVNSGDFAMRVYGTEFNLNTYNDERIELVLIEGSVGFVGKPEMDEHRLEPNQLAVIDSRTGGSEIAQVYTLPYVAWKRGDMVFVDEPLESVMAKLGRWYDVEVVWRNAQARNLRFDLNMPRYDDVTTLFYYMEKISDVRFMLDGRTIYIDMK